MKNNSEEKDEVLIEIAKEYAKRGLPGGTEVYIEDTEISEERKEIIKMISYVSLKESVVFFILLYDSATTSCSS